MARKGYKRTQRVADLIQVELAEILQRDVQGLGLGILTVTSVTLSPDLSHAKVYISVLDESKAKDTITVLNHASKDLRYTLAHAISLRITPELKFIYDDSALRGNRISSLIDDALKDK